MSDQSQMGPVAEPAQPKLEEQRTLHAPDGCGRLWSRAYGLLTKGEHAYALALLALQDMTEDDLREAMAKIAPELREALALGPLKPRWDCAICVVLNKNALREDLREGGWDTEDPLVRVFAYHEIPKAKMDHKDDQHYGELANDTYRRCLATYRAAGWDGVAAEPNA